MLSVFTSAQPIAIGSDHAGFEYKASLIKWLEENGQVVKDYGLYKNESVDYPDYAHPVASAVESHKSSFGILLCGSANGVCITANKHAGIRAALCWQLEIAKLARLHNDANIICIPARYIALPYTKDLIAVFMETSFEGGRHCKRVEKIACT